VRQRAVRPGGDDDVESSGVGAVQPQRVLYLDGDLSFRPAWPYQLERSLHDRSRKGRGFTHGPYFVLILSQPQALDELAARLEAHAWQMLGKRSLHRQGRVVGFQPEVLNPALAHNLGQPDCVLFDFDKREVRRFARSLQGETKIAQQQSVVGQYQKVAGAASEARQVAQMLGLAYQEGLNALSLRELPDFLDPLQIPPWA
jgi:hypothetical protein